MPLKSSAKTTELFPNPDTDIAGGERKARTSASSSKRSTAAKPRPPTGQAYLPGLSLRGRPRKQDSPKATERAAASRQKRLAAGTKRIELMLEPAVSLQLDALAQHFKESRTELVSRLLRKAASRHLR